MAESTPFLPPFFFPSEISSFWGASIAIAPSGTQKVLPTLMGRKQGCKLELELELERTPSFCRTRSSKFCGTRKYLKQVRVNFHLYNIITTESKKNETDGENQFKFSMKLGSSFSERVYFLPQFFTHRQLWLLLLTACLRTSMNYWAISNIITTKFKKNKICLLEIKYLMQKVGLSQAFSEII